MLFVILLKEQWSFSKICCVHGSLECRHQLVRNQILVSLPIKQLVEMVQHIGHFWWSLKDQSQRCFKSRNCDDCLWWFWDSLFSSFILHKRDYARGWSCTSNNLRLFSNILWNCTCMSFALKWIEIFLLIITFEQINRPESSNM